MAFADRARYVGDPHFVTVPGGLLDPARDEYQLFDELRALLGQTGEELSRHRRKILPALFRALPLLVVPDGEYGA